MCEPSYISSWHTLIIAIIRPPPRQNYISFSARAEKTWLFTASVKKSLQTQKRLSQIQEPRGKETKRNASGSQSPSVLHSFRHPSHPQLGERAGICALPVRKLLYFVRSEQTGESVELLCVALIKQGRRAAKHFPHFPNCSINVVSWRLE